MSEIVLSLCNWCEIG